MKVLIIEDEVLAASKLERLVLRHDPEYQVLNKLRSVEATVKWFKTHGLPDIVFLDIHLLDGTCFDIIKQVDINCPVIFTTAYEDYVFDSFKVYSIDYLIKPIVFKRLVLSLEKFEGIHQSAGNTPPAPNFEEMVRAFKSSKKDYKSRFLVKYGSRMLTIGVDQVGYFTSKDRISYLITNEGKKFPIGATMDELESTLDPAYFFRSNRNFIVCINNIKQVHKYFKGRLKIDLEHGPEDDVMVSSRRVSNFQSWLDR